MPTPAELKEQGLQHYRDDNLEEAMTAFAAAAQGFEAAGDRGAAAEMKNNLCVVYLAEKKWGEAVAVVEGTPEIFHELGDKLREAQALGNLANAHDNAKNYAPAAELYQRAIELFGELGEKENRAACFKALSALQVKHGKQMQALASMQSGLNLSENLSPREKTLKAMLDRALQMIRGR